MTSRRRSTASERRRGRLGWPRRRDRLAGLRTLGGRQAAGVRAPAALAHQRHEAHRAQPLLCEAVRLDPGHSHQLLQVNLGADRNDQTAPDRELLEERPRNLGAAGRDHDRVVRSVLGPAQTAVAVLDVDVAQTELAETPARQVGQLGVTLDGVDLARYLAQHRGRVAGAGADLEHLVAGLVARAPRS